jgi:hypothetical protein
MKFAASLVVVLIASGVQRTTSQSLLDEMPHTWGQRPKC